MSVPSLCNLTALADLSKNLSGNYTFIFYQRRSKSNKKLIKVVMQKYYKPENHTIGYQNEA